jgi:hypothetical protein
MPRMDGTGPMGEGRMTGRKRGPCSEGNTEKIEDNSRDSDCPRRRSSRRGLFRGQR